MIQEIFLSRYRSLPGRYSKGAWKNERAERRVAVAFSGVVSSPAGNVGCFVGAPLQEGPVTDVVCTRAAILEKRKRRGDVRKTKWRRLRRRFGIERSPWRLFAFSPFTPRYRPSRCCFTPFASHPPPLTSLFASSLARSRVRRPFSSRTSSLSVPPPTLFLQRLLCVSVRSRASRDPASWLLAFLHFNTFLNGWKNK